MIDHIRATIKNRPVEEWQNNSILDFKIEVSAKTGELSPKKKAILSGIQFIISYFEQNNIKCTLEGSLHKFHNREGINYSRFSFVEVQHVVNELASHFNIVPNLALLRSFEFGININLQYPPTNIIKSAICHKNEPAQPLNKFNKSLGAQFIHGEYMVKLYDKGKQVGFKGKNIMRLEIKVRRMRFVNSYSIKTLEDLTNRGKVEPLVKELLKVVQDIVFYDFNAKTGQLSTKELNQWDNFNNVNYWLSMGKSERYKAKQRFARLNQKVNAINYNEQLKKWVLFEWSQLFKATTGDLFTLLNGSKGNNLIAENGRPFHITIEPQKTIQLATFSHFKCNVNESPQGDSKNINQLLLFGEYEIQQIKRYCRTCGKDITHQKNGSIYCSEKYYGKQGKQCRNVEATKKRSKNPKKTQINAK